VVSIQVTSPNDKVGARPRFEVSKREGTPYRGSVRVLVVLVAVLVVNLPAAHQAWTDHRLADRGVDVEATVLEARTINGRHLVDYRLPKAVDPDGRRFSASIDDETYTHARDSHRLAVRVLAGHPGANRPAGEVSSPLFLVAAVGADLILLVVAALWLFRRRTRPDIDPETAPGVEPAG
jgi:hypothetical protein